MNLILTVLRLVLAMLFPSRRDGLSLAARTDGKMQHLPHSFWDWLLGERDDRPGRPAPPGPRARPGCPRRTVTFPTRSASGNG